MTERQYIQLIEKAGILNDMERANAILFSELSRAEIRDQMQAEFDLTMQEIDRLMELTPENFERIALMARSESGEGGTDTNIRRSQGIATARQALFGSK